MSESYTDQSQPSHVGVRHQGMRPNGSAGPLSLGGVVEELANVIDILERRQEELTTMLVPVMRPDPMIKAVAGDALAGSPELAPAVLTLSNMASRIAQVNLRLGYTAEHLSL